MGSVGLGAALSVGIVLSGRGAGWADPDRDAGPGAAEHEAGAVVTEALAGDAGLAPGDVLDASADDASADDAATGEGMEPQAAPIVHARGPRDDRTAPAQPVEDAAATAVPPPCVEGSPVEAVDAGPVARMPPAIDTEVASYTLRARLDPVAHTVDGEGTLTWKNTSTQPAHDLWLHLYLNAFESEGTLFARTGRSVRDASERRWGNIALRSFRMEGAGGDLLATGAHDPAVPDDRTQLRLLLPRPVAPGETVRFAMAWRSTLPSLMARTGAADRFHMVAQWFPKVAVREADGQWARFAFHANSEFYADFGAYDVTLTVPRGYTVGATGRPVEPVEHTPAGDRHHYVQDRVHDFAWVTWDRFREHLSTAGEVSLRVLHGPGDEGLAARVVDVLRDAMPRFARRYGSYPYTTLTVLVPPREAEEAGGMEYPTFITTDGVWWHPRRARYLEYVTVHEFGHQYFYGLLASNEHDHPFLDEGFCEYATARVMEDLYGPGGPIFDLPLLGPRIDTWAQESHHGSRIRFPMPVASRADEFPPGGRYGSHVYARTATVLRTLERTYGTARFTAAMRAYTAAWRFRHPTPDDFLAVMTEHLGAEAVDGFLRPALREPAGVDLAVTVAESHRTASGRWQGTVVLDREGGPSLPVTVVFEATDGTRTLHRWNPQTHTPYTLPYDAPRPLRRVTIDPDGQFPFDRNRLNNARLAVGNPEGSASDLSPLVTRAQWWIATLLRAVGP